ncbi:MAG: hypothetical protein JKY96_03595 [Phycisphaerales bacterium]|nr:hypothetical protein [Phycisphaerales bacterium]
MMNHLGTARRGSGVTTTTTLWETLPMKRATPFAAIALFGLCGLAIAGPDNKQDDKQTLRGPRVQQNTDQDQQGEKNERRVKKESKQRDQRAARPGAEMRVMIAAMRALKKAEGDLALSDEQEEQIKAIVKEHREAMKAFMEEHREELQAIRPEGAPERGQRGDRAGRQDRDDHEGMMDDSDGMHDMDGEKPDRSRRRGGADAKRDRPNPEARRAAMEKVKEIMKDAPNDGQARKKIMALLSDGQRDLVKKTMRKQRQRIEGRRGEMQNRRGQRTKQGEQAKRENRRGQRSDDAKQSDRKPRGAKRGQRKSPDDD